MPIRSPVFSSLGPSTLTESPRLGLCAVRIGETTPKRELLLVKGSSDSQLYKHAIQLSHPEDTRRLHPTLASLLTTVTGKPVGGAGWHRWLLYSESEVLSTLLRDNS